MAHEKHTRKPHPTPKPEGHDDPIARPGLEKLKWWVELIILPLIILGLLHESPEIWGWLRGKKSQLDITNDTIKQTSNQVMSSLTNHLEFTLGHGSESGGWSLVDDDTSVIPATESLQAQLHTDNGTGYVLEVDGKGTVCLLPDKELQDKYGSRYNVAPPSETIIGLALDPPKTDDQLPKIEQQIKDVFARQPALPDGRHIIWRPSGWSWTYQKGLKAPDPEGLAKEAQYKKWADSAQTTLKESLPQGTLYYGHTVAVK